MYTIAEKIQIAKVSQVLANQAAGKGVLFGQVNDPQLALKIYIVRKDLETLYALDSDSDDLLPISNLLMMLCEKYAIRAWAILSGATGGSTVTPSPHVTTTGYLHITENDFDNATDYTNSRLNGLSYRIFANFIARYLEEDEYEILAGGGFRILLSGFDATANEYEFYVDAQGELLGTSSSSVGGLEELSASYNLIANATVISSLGVGVSNQFATVAVRPNGYTYTWNSVYAFSETWPEQAGAIDTNTLQIYRFQYNKTAAKWVCVGQSLNIPI